MVTVVNTQPPANGQDSNSTWIVTVVILLLIAFSIFYWGGAIVRRFSGVPTINVPSQIDVNVNNANPSGQ